MDELPATCDVAIVGAGFAGLATAWWLARRGHPDVVVLEREPAAGRHASGRGAGLGRQVTDDDATTRLAVRGAHWLRSLAGTWPARPLWQATGSFLTFADESARAAHRARASRFGVDCYAVPVATVNERWPQLAGLPARGARWFPDDGVIDLGVLIGGLIDGARAGGARVVTGCAVGEVIARDGRVALATSRGAVEARLVVDAAGAWAGELAARWGGDDAGLVPWKRHVSIVDRAPPGGDAPFVWHVAPGEIYVRADAGATMVSPCDAAPSYPHDAAPDADANDRLQARLRTVAPELARAPVARTWACLRTFTRDRAPRIGVDAERPWLIWVAGLGGHGATAALAIGEDAAAAIAG